MRQIVKALSALAVSFAMIGTAIQAQEKNDFLPAFPGAEGFGAVSKGGRGGRIIKVTNLNADGPGSLQWACRQEGPRIVVFDVSGVIKPGNRSKDGRWIAILKNDITIAGQTAPGAGITIDGMLSTYRGDRGPNGSRGHYGTDGRTENVIARFLRIRPTEGGGNLRALEFMYCRRAIADHISGSWSLDQCFNPGYPKGDDIFTVQWCAIEETDPATLEGTTENHGFAYMGSWYPGHVSTHHNLLAHHVGRAPLLNNNRTEFSNNVLYNVGHVETQMGTSSKARPLAGEERYLLFGNYWKYGPGGLIGGWAFVPPLPCSMQGMEPHGKYVPVKIHFDGNRFSWDGYVGKERFRLKKEIVDEPFDFPPLTRHTAEEAYELVLAHSGCLPRDAVGKRTVAEVRTRTGSWGRYGPAGGLMEGLTPGEPPKDGDNDGMPDEWEKARKLDPTDPKDNNKIVPAGASPGDRHKGYTYIEYYINELADLKIAAALTAARLNHKPAKPWDKPANGLAVNTTKWHKSLDEIVAAIRAQDATQGNPQRDRKAKHALRSAWQAIIRLDRMKAEAAPAVSELAKGLARGTKDPRAVAFAAWSLGAIGPSARNAVPEIIKALKSEQQTTNLKNYPPYGFLAWALGRIGMNDKQTQEAAPTLGKLLTGKGTRASGNAAWALSRIGKAAEPVSSELLKALGSRRNYTGFFAAQALANIGVPSVPGLVKALGSNQKAVRANAARALGWMGSEAGEATDALIERIKKDSDGLVRAQAAMALAKIAPRKAEAIAGALSDPFLDARVSAAHALGECGQAAADAVPLLEKALADKRNEVKRAVALTLGTIGKPALPALKKALAGDDPFVRKYAARALGNMGDTAAGAVQNLTKALLDKDTDVQREAVWSLVLIGMKAKGTAEALKKALDDSDYVVRYAAGIALKRH